MSWTHCRRQSQMMDGALAGHDHTKGVAVAMVRRESETRFWYRDYGEEGQRTGGEGAKARHRPLVYSRLTRHDAHCCCGASAVAVGSSFPHRRFGPGIGVVSVAASLYYGCMRPMLLVATLSKRCESFSSGNLDLHD